MPQTVGVFKTSASALRNPVDYHFEHRATGDKSSNEVFDDRWKLKPGTLIKAHCQASPLQHKEQQHKQLQLILQ